MRDPVAARRLAEAVAAHGRGQLEEALRLYQQVLAATPFDADALSLFGMALVQAGHVASATPHLRRSLVLAPSAIAGLNRLAIGLLRGGQPIAALAVLVRSLAVRKDVADTHLNCGNLLFELAEWSQAIGCYDKAIALEPGYAEAHANRSSALQSAGRADEARSGYHRAIAIKPENFDAHGNLGVLDQGMGETDAAMRRYRRALAIDPNRPAIHSNLLFALTYAESVDGEDIYRAFRDWEARHARPLYAEVRAHANAAVPDRRLRVGYLSADFRDHPIAFNLVESLERHDRNEIELILYALTSDDGAMARRFRATADRWRDVTGRDERQIAAQIRSDGIDVLVLVAPHTADNRPLVAALKPAPVQVALYDLTTTGMTTVDAWITDPFIHPPERTVERFVETLIRVPCLVTHMAPDPSPPLVAAPSTANGIVTFGSFSNPAKLTRSVIATWAEVLARTPGSRLLMKYLDRLGDGRAARRLIDLFAAHGIGLDRLQFRSGRLSRVDHLALLNEVDIALEPFPFNGCTSTFEALWMGVPVVTFEGDRFLSRMSGSFLRHIGCADLVAADRAEYVAKAAALAADLPRRSELRLSLRDLVRQSPLCDPGSHARSLVSAYRELWRRWCAGRGVQAMPAASGMSA